MSLRQRLIMLVTLVLGVSLLIGLTTAHWRAAGKVKTELHAALVVGKQILDDAVKEIERAPNPFQQMRIVIERFSGGRHLKVSLIDASGGAVASSRLAVEDDPAPEWFNALIGGEPETEVVNLPRNVTGYSKFFIQTDSRNEIHEFWEDLTQNLAVLAVLSVLVLGLIHFFLGRELRPLQDLNLAFSRIAGGDFSARLTEQRSADLKRVSHGFNHMARRLQQAEGDNALLQEQLTTVQEEERTELARDLHDEIGPLLFTVSIDAATVQKALGDTAPAEVMERLKTIRESVSLSQKHVLGILGRLRVGTVEDLGLRAAIARLVDFWSERNPHLAFDVQVPESGVGADRDAIAYRIVQESLSNAIRHANPSRIEICVSQSTDGETRVGVMDDGGGLRSKNAGHGITGMRERVASLRGTLTIRNRNDGRGVIVTADLPSKDHSVPVSSQLEVIGVHI